ncbi:hypothetical protein HYALB_00006143 [Hymenoscyphus albidus]|uniref:Uncharacterized protein n=1 Tax=Hymenoscyphus albidus TaxID=595503 RepID=A0A9N9LJ24_9HELO|nr:hypothetical protein HYALB_00006143 [Hymenoscyphus albidus]
MSPESRTWRSFIPVLLHASEQPVSQSNDLCTHAILPVSAFLYVFYRMLGHPALLVKFEDEEACKLFAVVFALSATEPIECSYSFSTGLTDGSPSHDELLRTSR